MYVPFCSFHSNYWQVLFIAAVSLTGDQLRKSCTSTGQEWHAWNSTRNGQWYFQFVAASCTRELKFPAGYNVHTCGFSVCVYMRKRAFREKESEREKERERGVEWNWKTWIWRMLFEFGVVGGGDWRKMVRSIYWAIKQWAELCNAVRYVAFVRVMQIPFRVFPMLEIFRFRRVVCRQCFIRQHLIYLLNNK